MLRKNARWTDGQTDRQTDNVSYRDARTHLKRTFVPKIRESVVLF